MLNRVHGVRRLAVSRLAITIAASDNARDGWIAPDHGGDRAGLFAAMLEGARLA